MNPPIPMKSPLKRIGNKYVVYTGTIYSPSHFYVIKAKNVPKVEKYSRAVDKYLRDFPIFDAGMLGPLQAGSCAVKIADSWLRGNILAINNGFAALDLVDIGGVLRFNTYDLRPLPPTLTLSTGKAIRVHLSNLEPKFEGAWPESETRFLEDLLARRPLKMKGIHCRGGCTSLTLGIELHDRPTGLDIRRILLNRGFATEGFIPETLLTDIPSQRVDILIEPNISNQNQTDENRSN